MENENLNVSESDTNLETSIVVNTSKEVHTNLAYNVEIFAEEKKLNSEYLKSCGLQDDPSGTSVIIPYYDVNGQLLAIRYRNHPNSNNRFAWKQGSTSNLYGLWILNSFNPSYVIIVEGESDALTLWGYGIQAIRSSSEPIVSKMNMHHILQSLKKFIFTVMEMQLLSS